MLAWVKLVMMENKSPLGSEENYGPISLYQYSLGKNEPCPRSRMSQHGRQME